MDFVIVFRRMNFNYLCYHRTTNCTLINSHYICNIGFFFSDVFLVQRNWIIFFLIIWTHICSIITRGYMSWAVLLDSSVTVERKEKQIQSMEASPGHLFLCNFLGKKRKQTKTNKPLYSLFTYGFVFFQIYVCSYYLLSSVSLIFSKE